jgi:hypothetical protein
MLSYEQVGGKMYFNVGDDQYSAVGNWVSKEFVKKMVQD